MPSVALMIVAAGLALAAMGVVKTVHAVRHAAHKIHRVIRGDTATRRRGE